MNVFQVILEYITRNRYWLEYLAVIGFTFMFIGLLGTVSSLRFQQQQKAPDWVPTLCFLDTYYTKEANSYFEEMDRIRYCYLNYFNHVPRTKIERGVFMYCDHFSWVNKVKTSDMISNITINIIKRDYTYPDGKKLPDFRSDLIQLNYCLFEWAISVITSREKREGELYHTYM